MTTKKRIPIEQATLEDLKAFATVVLGLELDGRATADSIRAKLKTAGYQLETIPAEVTEMTTKKQVYGKDFRTGIPTFTKQNPDTGETIIDPDCPKKSPMLFARINIPITSKPGGDEPVAVGVNGRAMAIPRGKDVDVPMKYVEVLMNAKEMAYEEYDPTRDMLGGLGMPSLVDSYPFSVQQPIG